MTDYQRIEKIIRFLDHHYQEQPSLATLAKAAGLSEFHFHRLFSRWAGTTPKGFLKALTAAHAKRLLQESRDVLSVSLETGLSGPGRLHDLLVTVEGVSPGEYKAAGAGVEIRYGTHATPFGDCLLGVSPRGITHLAFATDRSEKTLVRELASAWPEACLVRDQRGTAEIASEIFAQERKKNLSVFLKGTGFQLKVWEALLRIPPGHRLSYGDIAARVGRPGASRAVGTAVGNNPIGYLIPCHRIIRETGVIGEYRWGTQRKRAILAYESETGMVSPLEPSPHATQKQVRNG